MATGEITIVITITAIINPAAHSHQISRAARIMA